MKYFDSFAFLGKRQLESEEELWTKSDVIELMDRCGIDAALVYHTMARDYAPIFGNQELIKILKEEPRLFGCYVAMPHFTGEMPPPDVWLEDFNKNKFKAVKIFPQTHKFEVNSYSLDLMLNMLQAEKIPLLVDITEINFGALEFMATRYPRLPILVQKLYWDQSRQLIPLFAKLNNIHIEFSSYQGFCLPDWFWKQFGAERLLFGSEMPIKTPGAARSLIDYADISEKDKQLIAAGNLMRLLNVKELPPFEFKPRDQIISQAITGKPIDKVEIIDAHSHVGYDKFQGAAMVFMPEADPENQRKKDRRLGIQKTCVSTWIGIWHDSVLGNMQMEEIRQKFPDHYIPYLTIDPTFLTDAEIKTTIQKYHGNLKYPGLKPYFPRNHYPLTGPQYHQWFQYGNDHKLFALIHYDAPTTYNDIDKLAPKYPDLFFLVAHSGCSYTAASRVIQLAKKYKNVYAELTFTSVLSRVVEILCREITADRVLFGADTPMRDPAPQVGWVVYANLTFEEKKKVLGENMRKILMRAGWK